MKARSTLKLVILLMAGFSMVFTSCNNDAENPAGFLTKFIESEDINFLTGGSFLGAPAGTLTVNDADISGSAAVLAYMRIGAGEEWYALPYSWASGTLNDYLTYRHDAALITFFAFTSLGESIPTNIKRIKYIIMYNPESRMMNSIDIKDHDAVMECLGIKDL